MKVNLGTPCWGTLRYGSYESITMLSALTYPHISLKLNVVCWKSTQQERTGTFQNVFTHNLKNSKHMMSLAEEPLPCTWDQVLYIVAKAKLIFVHNITKTKQLWIGDCIFLPFSENFPLTQPWASTCAPFSNNTLHISSWPPLAAKCNGVLMPGRRKTNKPIQKCTPELHLKHNYSKTFSLWCVFPRRTCNS